jgi:DNA processing protein
MTRLEALVGLNLVPEIGSIRLNILLELFGTPQNLLNAPYEKLISVLGIGEKIAHNITSLKKEDVEKEFQLAQKHNLKIITQDDPEYPENLKKIYDPPIVLYIKGDLLAQDKLSIAIVGSRRASFYGLTAAEKFAYELANLGFTVVSGLAYGIDTQAHKGALRAKGRTLAVLGNGLANIYPAQNKELSEQIAQNGAVISEFPVSTNPLKQNFPRRNRVISGLSLGVLVVEAARNSGALITADFALEQGREVFALPGKIDSGTSFGTNGLIKQGAKLVSHIEDIIEELNLGSISNNALPKKTDGIKDGLKEDHLTIPEELTNEESVLYNTLSYQPLHLDDIVDRLGLNASCVLNTLLRLEIKKLICQLPGKQFARSTNA